MAGKIIVTLTLICLVGPVLAITSDLQACLQQTDKNSQDSVNLADDCPHVYKILQHSWFADALEQPAPKQFTQAQLKFLQTSLQNPETKWVLDEHGLDDLLKGILTDQGSKQELSWWKQFLDWLNSVKPEKYEAEYDWLIRFLAAITPSERVARIFMFTAFGLTILAAAGFVFWELYLAGVFSNRRAAKTKPVRQETRPDVAVSPVKPLSEIQKLAPDIQVVALFNNVINHLTEKKLLPGNAALTNSELQEHLRKQKSLAGSAFTCLVENVEPVLYGYAKPDQHELENCWQNAQQILTQ